MNVIHHHQVVTAVTPSRHISHVVSTLLVIVHTQENNVMFSLMKM